MKITEILRENALALKYAYHITPSKNLDAIMKYGLSPSPGDEDSSYSDEERLYLFPSLDDAKMALRDWAPDRFIGAVSLLKVNVTGIKLEPTEVEWEIYTYSKITPDRLQLVSI